MLIIGETFASRKADLLDYIKVCRQLISVINSIIKKYPDLDNATAYEVMQVEQQQIKDTMEELIKLQKWFSTQARYKEGKV